MTERSRIDEWRTMWPLPLTAMLGVAATGALPYSTGVFMEALTHEFGWTKTQFTSSMAFQLPLLLVLLPLVGRLIDRFGSRRVALAGLVPALAGNVAMSLTSGELWQWWLLHVFQSTGLALIVPPVWITVIAGRFRASRGLAIAVTLAGIGAGTALWPILASYYIEHLGWRMAYVALGFTWWIPLVPMTIFCFRDAADRPATGAAPRPATAARAALLSPVFILLATATALFVLVTYSMLIHLVPILRGSGLNLPTAAAVAGVTGLASIFGRLVTGALLDFLPTKPFAVITYLLPSLAVLLLGTSNGSMPMLMAGAAVLGLAMGAESDIAAFIAARRFDHEVFGSLFSIIQTATAVAALGGTMAAGYLFDIWGSYGLFLTVAVPVSILASLCIACLPRAQPTVPVDSDALSGNPIAVPAE